MIWQVVTESESREGHVVIKKKVLYVVCRQSVLISECLETSLNPFWTVNVSRE